MISYKAVNRSGIEISNNQIVELLRHHDGYMSVKDMAKNLDVPPTEENLTAIREHCYHLGLKNKLYRKQRLFTLEA